MHRIKVAFSILMALVVFSCDRHYSSDRMHEVPKFDKEFLNKAIDHLDNSIEDYPENADNYYKKALVLIELGSYGSALLQAKKAHSLNKNDPEYLYLLANLYSINNKSDEALETALQAVKLGASKPRLYSLIAEIYLEKGSAEIALQNIEKAITLNPSQNDYTFIKGKILLEKGDTVAAETNFLQTPKGGFVHKEAFLNLTNIYIAQGKYAKASETIEKLLVSSPDDIDVLLQKAVVLTKLEQPDSAKEIYGQIMNRDSTNVAALNALANYHYTKNRFDSANYYATKSLAVGEKKTFPLLIQARVLDRTRQYYEAIAKYESILAIDSTYKVAADEMKYVRNKVAYIQRRQDEERQRSLEVMPTIEPVF